MDKKIKQLIIITLSLLSLYLIYLLSPGILSILKFIFKIVLPFLIGFVVAFTLLPLVEYLTKNGTPRKWSVFIVVFITFLVIIALFSILIPILVKELVEITNNLPLYITKISNFLDNLSNKLSFLPDDLKPTPKNIETLFFNNINTLIDYLIRIIQKTFSYFLVIIISPILTIYFLLDFDKIQEWFKRNSSGIKYQKRRLMLVEIKDTMKAYLKGIFWVMIILTILASLGFYFVGLDYAFVFGLIVGITDIIPYLGPYIGGSIVFFATLTISLKQALLALIIIVIIQIIESSFLTPKIQSHQVKTHPILVILALAFFGEILGIFGMLIAVPMLSIIQTIYKTHFLEKNKHF